MWRRGEGASEAERMRLPSWMMLVLCRGVGRRLIVMMMLMVVVMVLVVGDRCLPSVVLCTHRLVLICFDSIPP